MTSYCARCGKWRALDPVALICHDCYEDFRRNPPGRRTCGTMRD